MKAFQNHAITAFKKILNRRNMKKQIKIVLILNVSAVCLRKVSGQYLFPKKGTITFQNP